MTGVKRPLSVEGARRGVLLAVAGRAGTGSVDGGGLRSDFGHSDIACVRLSTSLSGPPNVSFFRGVYTMEATFYLGG